MDYMQRLEGKLAPQYAAAGQRIELEERRAEDKRLSEAMSGARDLTMTQSRTLVDTIRAIHAGGTTIIWIEHIVHALLSVASRLVVMNFGKKIAEGDPEAVMNDAEVREVYMGIPAS